MKKIILAFSSVVVIIFVVALGYSSKIYTQNNNIKGKEMMTKIKISFGDNEIVAYINESPTAKDFLKTLPIVLSFDDYNNTEKIARVANKLNIEGVGYDHTFLAGDIAYYAPWDNLVIYYKDFKYSGGGIIKLGKMESDYDKLKEIKGKISIKIEK